MYACIFVHNGTTGINKFEVYESNKKIKQMDTYFSIRKAKMATHIFVFICMYEYWYLNAYVYIYVYNKIKLVNKITIS